MQILGPQAEVWTPASTLDPDIGSIAWVDLSSAPGAGLNALEYLLAFPWVQVLTAGPEDLASKLRGQLPSPDLVAGSLGPQPAASEARMRLESSPVPTCASIAAWLAARIGRPDLGPMLTAMLGTAGAAPWDSAGVSRRAFYRRAGAVGPFRPGDWRRLAGLARQTRRGESTVEHLASRVGVGVKALRGQVESLLGLTVAEYRETPGWAWVLESALRRHGLVAAPAAFTVPRVTG